MRSRLSSNPLLPKQSTNNGKETMLPNLHKWIRKRRKRMARKLGLNKAPHRKAKE